MKRLLACVLVAAVALVALNSDSFAGANANAKIQLHLKGVTTKNACTTWGVPVGGCAGIITNGKLVPNYYYAYVLVTDGNAAAGIAGLQFGIQYNGAPNAGVDVFAWTLCATLQFAMPTPVWPSAGGGNLITWDSTNACQRNEPGGPGTGVIAVAGYFYCGAYSADTMTITVRPADGAAKVADCAAVEDLVEGGAVGVRHPSHLGSAAFSQGALTPGYNPCGLNTPVQNTTWSAVKSTFTK